MEVVPCPVLCRGLAVLPLGWFYTLRPPPGRGEADEGLG